MDFISIYLVSCRSECFVATSNTNIIEQLKYVEINLIYTSNTVCGGSWDCFFQRRRATFVKWFVHMDRNNVERDGKGGNYEFMVTTFRP